MKKNLEKIFLYVISLFIFFSCSVKYEEETKSSSIYPEFIFYNTIYTKMKDNNLSIKLFTDKLEKYKRDSAIFANGINFTSYDDENQIESFGSCGYLYANTDNKIYEMFKDIKIDSKKYSAKFEAEALKYNQNNDQLIGTKNDTVKIEKDDTIIYGTGFSASGVSSSFSFAGTVTGEINTKENSESNDE